MMIIIVKECIGCLHGLDKLSMIKVAILSFIILQSLEEQMHLIQHVVVKLLFFLLCLVVLILLIHCCVFILIFVLATVATLSIPFLLFLFFLPFGFLLSSFVGRGLYRSSVVIGAFTPGILRWLPI